MSTLGQLVYALAFQVGWFVCITMGNLASILYALVFLICHLSFMAHKHSGKHIGKEILWIIVISCLGLIIETIYFSTGLLYIETQKHLYHRFVLPPLWLICIWVMFSLALRTCLAFLFNKRISTYLICMVFVPINYYAGANLNTQVNINEPFVFSLVLLTLVWLLFWWTLSHVKKSYFEELFNAN
ncbi:MAG: DUF2878 domain-containing protein [Gammaproteobacteria bacterium]|nr:MAG: DUF2878 domain-containing protein [Gammaproteobacteria bacterium]